MAELETLLFEVSDKIATITLNRPQSMNAFNSVMLPEMKSVWQRVQADDDIHVAILRAAPGRAFCTGVDVREGRPQPTNLWSHLDPGEFLSPKMVGCWKPVVTAVHGMCAGGAF